MSAGMKYVVSILLAAICLVTVGQVAYAYSQERPVHGAALACHVERLSPFDSESDKTEDSVDPVLSTSELSSDLHQVRSSPVDAPPYRGGLLGASLTRTPRYILVRRLLI